MAAAFIERLLRVKNIVELSDEALMQIVLNGLEAFIVRHDHVKRSGIEMHGHLAGFYSETVRQRKIQVTHFSCDTSATMMPGEVSWKYESNILKRSLISGFGLDYLGQVHSHPYMTGDWPSVAEARRVGAEFSDTDIEAGQSMLKDFHQRYGDVWHLEMVATFYHTKNAVHVKKYDELKPEFSIGNVRCFLRADIYEIIEGGEITRQPAVIRSPFIQKGRERDVDIGRVRVKPGRKYTLQRVQNGEAI